MNASKLRGFYKPELARKSAHADAVSRPDLVAERNASIQPEPGPMKRKYLQIRALDGECARNEMDATLWTLWGLVNELDANDNVVSCLGTYAEQFPRTMPLGTAARLAEENGLRMFGDLYGRDLYLRLDVNSVESAQILGRV